MRAILSKLRRAIDRRRGAQYVYSSESIGKFDSREAALAAHANYPHDTDAEGQFDPSFRTYVRVKDTLDGIPPGTRVLDVGCNTGGLGRHLIAEKSCEMYGVDISASLVERACAKGYSAYAGQAEQLSYDDAMFDVVVVSEVLEHVHDPRPVLSEARRVLRSGGLLFGDVPTEGGRWGFETIEGHEFHARVFTCQVLEELLGGYFAVDYVKGAPEEEEEHPCFDVPTWYVFRCRKAW